MMRAGAMLLVAVFVGGVAWANDSTKKEGTKLTWSEISQIKKLSRRGAKIWLEYKDHIDDSGRPKKVDRPGKDHISITQNFHGVSSASISEAATIDKPGVTTKVTVGRALGEKTPGSIEMKRVFFYFRWRRQAGRDEQEYLQRFYLEGRPSG